MGFVILAVLCSAMSRFDQMGADEVHKLFAIDRLELSRSTVDDLSGASSPA